MGFFDAIFGESPDARVEQHSVLTPEQEQLLQQLIGTQQLAGGGNPNIPAFGGNLNVGLSDLENLSLDALEQRATQQATGGSPLQQEGVKALIEALQGSQTDTTDFFNTNIRDPALKSFEETVLPNIGRTFGGADFFGSERQQTDSEAREDLIDSLTQSRTKLQFESSEAAKERALKAAGIIPEFQQQGISETLALLAAGAVPREVETENMGREFAEFTRQQDERARRIKEILSTLDTRAIENIALVNQGSSGLAGSFLSGGGLGDLFGDGSSGSGWNKFLSALSLFGNAGGSVSGGGGSGGPLGGFGGP